MTAAINKHKKLHHLSVSQLKTFGACPRKWGFEKIDKVQVPPTGKQALGTNVHGHLEHYGLTRQTPQGDTPDVQAALAIINGPLASLDLTGALTEFPLAGVSLAGVPLEGYIDLLLKTPHGPEVYDYKTTSSLRYAKSATDLETDVQMVIYAHAALLRTPADECMVGHIVCTTPGRDPAEVYKPKVRVTRALVLAKNLPELLAPIEATAERMVEAAGASSGAELQPNFAACSDYGGCPFRNRCLAAAGSHIFDGLDDVQLEANTMDATTVNTASRPLPSIVPPDAPKPSPVTPWTPPTTDATPAPTTGTTGFSLYVDCVPERVGATNSLETYVDWLAREVCREAGVPDIRLVDYGKGKGMLANAARQHPPVGLLVGRTGELTSVVVEALAASATVLCRGVR